MGKEQETDVIEKERRSKKDRRSDERRLDERRMAGIGEIIPERRDGPRREAKRRGPGRRG